MAENTEGKDPLIEFASSYIYEYDKSDDEYISEGEFEAGMTLSDESEDEAEHEKDKLATFFNKLLKRKKTTSTEKKKLSHWRRNTVAGDKTEKTEKTDGESSNRKQWRKADTNVVSVRLNELLSTSSTHTGDPTYCKKCSCIMSHISCLKNKEKEVKSWTCEFCGMENIIMNDDKPAESDVYFLLEPAIVTKPTGTQTKDESVVVFCLDVSGSMCMTTEVRGKVNLRGNRKKIHKAKSFDVGNEDQNLPGDNSKYVTYITRLQCMQAAVDHQLAEMEKEHPDRKVALVAFFNEVLIVGDGSRESISIGGAETLRDQEKLMQLGLEYKLEKPVKESRQILGQKVFQFQEGGTTALGPALVVSVGIASHSPGSKVIICTDGKANVGLGSLEVASKDTKALDAVEDFYVGLAEKAKEKSVTISVTTIRGTDCKLSYLGKVAEITRGHVNIVDPLKLTEQFGNILANKIIATNVIATFILYPGLYFRHEDTKESKVVKDVGNVTSETEISFEFGINHTQNAETSATTYDSDNELPVLYPEDKATAASSSSSDNPENCPRLPFQLQIQYTDVNGAKAMRVVTGTKPVTKNRSLAEKDMNIAVLGTRTAHLTSQLARTGEYTKARSVALVNQRLIAKSSWANKKLRPSYAAYVRKLKPIENQLLVTQQTERKKYGRTHSESEESDSQDEGEASHHRKGGVKVLKKQTKKSRTRTVEQTDKDYDHLYHCGETTTRDFQQNIE